MVLLHLLQQFAWGDVPIYLIGVGHKESYDGTGVDACAEECKGVVIVEITQQLLFAYHEVGGYSFCQLLTSADLGNYEVEGFLLAISDIAEQDEGIRGGGDGIASRAKSTFVEMT